MRKLVFVFLAAAVMTAPLLAATTERQVTGGIVSGEALADGGTVFRSIPFAQPPLGELRWKSPAPVQPWDGVRDATKVAPPCLQRSYEWNAADAFNGKEDCLYIAVQSPRHKPTDRLPVMVWIHGGSNRAGDGHDVVDSPITRRGVVLVTIQYRLGVFGFLSLPALTSESPVRASGNYGLMDQIAALQWVKENIANFGGDPNKVMIYGQSGGGGKVATLMGMPSAKGLFHRAAIQSGGSFAGDKDEAKEFARMLVKQLSIGPNDIGALQKLDWASLNAAANAAQGKMPPRPGPFGAMPGPPARFWMPTVDGRVITENTFQNSAPEISKDVPLIIGSVSEEGNSMRSRPTEAQWRANLARAYGVDKGKVLADALRKAHPEKSIRTLSYMCGGGGILNAVSIRNSVVHIAKLKHDLKAAPVYTYYFSWQSPMLEDAGAWHTADLAFCFDNTKRCEQGTGNTPEAQALAKKMATAWANFARTGNPSQPGLTWTPSDPEHNQTMVWDNDCRVVNDPEGEIRKIILS